MPPTHMLAHHRGGGGVRDDPHRATRNSDTHTPNRKPEPEPSSNLSHIGTLTTRQLYCQGVKVKASNIAWPNADAFYGLWTHTAPPEALVKAPAHSPSTTPLTCPVARPSQRELHKDGGGGGGGLARRARAARAPKARSFATSCGTSLTSCAASFSCPSFMCHQRAGVGGGSRPGHRAPQHTFLPKGCVRRALNALNLHVSTATATGPEGLRKF